MANHNEVEIEVGADTREFTRKFNKVERKVNGLEGEIYDLRSSFVSLGDKSSNVFERMSRNLSANISDGINDIARKFNKLGDKFSPIIKGFKKLRQVGTSALKQLKESAIFGESLIPTSLTDLAIKLAMLIPLLGIAAHVGTLLVGALGGLASAATATIGAFGAFAAIATPVIIDLFKMNAAIEAGEKKWSDLTDAQHEAIHALRDLKKYWGKLTKSLDDKVLKAFTKGMESVQDILEELEPLFKGVADAMIGLMSDFKDSIQSADMQAFFRFLNTRGVIIFENMTRAMGNFLAGILNLMEAFGPLGQSMSSGLLDMSRSFRQWAATIENNPNFQQFIAYVREQGPKFLHILGQVIEFFGRMSEVLRPIGSVIVSFIGWLAELFNDFAAYLERIKRKHDTFKGQMSAIWEDLKEKLGEIAKKAYEEIKKWISDDVKALLASIDLSPLGKDMMDSLIEGIKNAIPGLKAVMGIVDSIIHLEPPGQQELRGLPRGYGGRINASSASEALAGAAVTQSNNDFNGMFSGANFYVNNEQDIEELAQQLGEYINDQSRGEV